MPRTAPATNVRNPPETEEMTTAEMLATLLYQRECAIAELQETIQVQAITIRWLKHLMAEQDQEIARAQELANHSFLSQLD
jgi:uncharacterized coiled-coil protein SlyX